MTAAASPGRGQASRAANEPLRGEHGWFSLATRAVAASRPGTAPRADAMPEVCGATGLQRMRESQKNYALCDLSYRMSLFHLGCSGSVTVLAWRGVLPRGTAKPLVVEAVTTPASSPRGFFMLFYRAALPLSRKTLTFTAGIIRRHRRSIGSAWRKLNPGQQALLVLVYLRKGETFAELAAGFGVRTATAWRYIQETVALLAARAPKLRQAVRDARKAWHA